VTGFEPFAGSDDNPSARVLEAIACGGPLDTLRTALLPVSTNRMPGILNDLLAAHRPDVVVGLGEARGSTAVRIECIATNRLDCGTPDNDGVVIAGASCVPKGQACLDASLPVDRLIDAIRAAGVACERSTSAGAFLCNQMMYLALHWAARQPRRPVAGFIHLPSLPTQSTSQAAAAGHSTMPLEDLVRATRAALDALASSHG
jgi:pyroglutamyl-peptidase